ncbi:uncharacterized protein LOC113791326 [Dermatophagoides pteronyssinus]|uniref:uncharacterized protein LOC113791326 n=1 Tax=Dermatophagoides pteronyssinus TaxID=6956 RepID=UPI003F661112
MEHQILICNEPSPQSPTPSSQKQQQQQSTKSTINEHHSQHVASSSSSSSPSLSLSSLGQNHHLNIRSQRNHGGSSSSYWMAINYQSILDQSSPTSDSSGYDSNTSIQSSIHSNYGDDEHYLYHYQQQQTSYNRNIRKRKQYDCNIDYVDSQQQQQQQLQTKSSLTNLNRISISHHQQQQQQSRRRQQQQQQLMNEPKTVISQLDYNLLNDQERILKQMLSIEYRYIPWNIIDMVYRSSTNNINEQTRFELIEWMHEVCEQYKCEPGIFSLSVNYLDRFILAKPNIPKQHLQLAGIVCMLIASKIRQCNTFDLEFLIYASDHAFTVEEILIWEQHILKELSWDVSSIIANDYLDYLLVILTNIIKKTNTCQKLNDEQQQKQKQNQQQCRRSHRIRRYSIVDNHHNHHHQQDDVDIERLRKSVRRISKNIENNDNVTDVGDDIDSLNISSSSLRKRKTSIRNLNHTTTKRIKSTTSRHDDDDDDESIVCEKQHNKSKNDDDDDDDHHHQSCSSTSSTSTTASTIEAIIRRHANTFIELCSIDITFVSVEPSVIASACVATALQGLDINRTLMKSPTDIKTSTTMMKMTPEQSISTTNYMITTNDNNSNNNNNGRHFIQSKSNDQHSIIPNDLCEQFLLAVEKQIGIDSHLIKSYAKLIDNLIRNESSSISSERNSMAIVDDVLMDMNLPEISSSSSSQMIINTNDMIVVPTPLSTTAANITISIDTNLPATMNAHCYNQQQQQQQQHSTINNTTFTIANSNHHNQQNYIHTTFAQVPCAKQLLLNNNRQQQQHDNCYIPQHYQRSCSLLHDTTNDNSSNGSQMTTTTTTTHWIDDISFKTQSSLTDLLSYLEHYHEDRENIPIFIQEQQQQPAPSSLINIDLDEDNETDDADDNDDEIDQENRPPSSLSSTTTTNIRDRSGHISQLTIDIDNEIDDNDHHHHDEGLGEDLYF